LIHDRRKAVSRAAGVRSTVADAGGPAIKVGLVGRGIQGSRSPAMHMEEAESQGLPLSYVLLDLDAPPNVGLELSQVIDAAEREGFAGVNVTYPFKQAVIPLLDDLSQDARRLGAVNTVVFRNGRRTGHNTDWSGFAESFRRGLKDAPLARAVQVGAGGAGAAVAYALLDRGVGKLQLFDLDRDRATELVANLKALFGEARAEVGTDIAAAMATADGLANATPVGMTKYPGTPIPTALLRPTQWVAEVVYFPLETELLAAARALGCRTLDGGGMAVFQAAEAFRLFTGVTPDTERMRAWFLAAVDRGEPVAADLHE
jgi:shikimate dehydrogenase